MLYVALELKEGSVGSRLFMSGVEVILLVFSLYILFGVRRLLEWRYDAPTLRLLLLLIVVGMIWQSVGVVVSRAIYDYSSHDESIRTISEYTSALDFFLLVSRVFGRTMMGVGLMIFGLRVQQVDDPMYGLRNALGIGVMFMGFCATTFGLFINLRLLALAELASLGMIFGHVLIWLLAILLFFRAVYRNPIRQPIQTA